MTNTNTKTSREAFEESFRFEFRHKSDSWIDKQLIAVEFDVGYVGAVASSHWQTWQAALAWIEEGDRG